MHGLKHRAALLAAIISTVHAIAWAETSVAPVARIDEPGVIQANAMSVRAPSIDAPEELEDLLSLTANDASEMPDNEQLGRQHLVNTGAFEIGLARGFMSKIQSEVDRIEWNSDLLDRAFDFRTLFLIVNHEHPVEQSLHRQPPVISELEDVVQIEHDGAFLRTIDGVYRIIKPERFVSAPPRWQDYLLTGLDIPAPTVNEVMLPRNASERRIWKKAVAAGWQQGQYQAESEIKARIHSLGVDYNGMLAYLELKLSGKVNEGYVARQRRGLEGGGSELSVNSRTYQITNKVSLNPNLDKWKVGARRGLPASYEAAGVRLYKDVDRCGNGGVAECP